VGAITVRIDIRVGHFFEGIYCWLDNIICYLPENLFYNTPAPGIVLFMNKAKPKKRQGKVLLVNASQIFEKSDPKNYIPDEGIKKIADTLKNWEEVFVKLARRAVNQAKK